MRHLRARRHYAAFPRAGQVGWPCVALLGCRCRRGDVWRGEDERIASGGFPVCAASAADSAHADFALDKQRSGHRGDESARVRDDAVPRREVECSRRVERLLPLCVRGWLGVPVRHGPSRPRGGLFAGARHSALRLYGRDCERRRSAGDSESDNLLRLRVHRPQLVYLLVDERRGRASWTNAVVGRVLHENVAGAETIDASIELFRNGDVGITTNGVTELIPRVLPFPHDGFGQDEEWIAANFTNATEILAVGYPQWVDAQVGENLTNGLYKFTVTIPEVPPETVRLVVGDYSVAVTNAGDYVFLLEKGIDYPYGTFPFLASVTYSAVDDVPQTRGGMRSSEDEGAMHRWTVDGGYGINPQTDSALGLVWWMPVFFGSPDVPHLGPDDGPLTFTANFSDCRVEPAASYSWTASDGLTVASPSAKATQISADTMPSWAQATVSVTATVGDHTLRSDLYGFSYGVNDTPQVRLSLNVPNAILLNSNLVDAAKVASAGWTFSSDVPTSGVVTVSCLSGGDRVECQGLLGTWEISDVDNFSVEAHIQGVLASAAVGDVALQAVFTSGDMLKSETRLLTVVRTKDVVIPAAPSNGLVVLKNTPVSMSLECEPTGAGTYLTTTWQTRRLKSDGTHEQWCPIVSNQAGVAAGFIPTQGGIYQVRALASVAAGGTDERFYVWDADESPVVGLKKRGDIKSFGVCDEQWQIDLRNQALSYVGQAQYTKRGSVSAQYGFSELGSYDWKCNIFVAHMGIRAGLTIPHNSHWFSVYAPVANDWANGTGIEGWEFLGRDICVQPGYVVGHPATTGSGHCGIVDFDGCAIGAGVFTVNRQYKKWLDGTSGFHAYRSPTNNGE